MLAARYTETGPSSVLRVEEIEAPSPGPGEVLVRVVVSGVNPTDWKSRSGATTRGDIDPFQVPNQDGSGTIEAVGAGVDPGRVGERVWLLLAATGHRWGSAAQQVVVPAGHAVPLPDDASFDLGACLGVPALTAHRCLLADGPVRGCTVLVHGGAGAVGHMAIQLAVWLGARVITTVSSPEKAAIAVDAGAHEVVDYRAEDAGARIRDLAPEGIDRVVEVNPSANLALDLAVCAPNAAIAVYADGGADPSVAIRAMMTRNLVIRGVLLYTVPQEAMEAAIGDVTRALHEGVLAAPPLHRFALRDVAAAHDAVEAGTVGKVLIDIP